MFIKRQKRLMSRVKETESFATSFTLTWTRALRPPAEMATVVSPSAIGRDSSALIPPARLWRAPRR
jgi:hypothetical protein